MSAITWIVSHLPAIGALAIAFAALAWTTLTEARAVRAAAAAGLVLSVGVVRLASPPSAWALTLVVLALAIRSRGGSTGSIAASLLSPVIALLSAGLSVAACASSSWRARSRWQPILEGALVSVVLLVQGTIPLGFAILLPLTSAGIGWLVIHRAGSLGKVPSRAAVISFARWGIAAGVFALLVADRAIGVPRAQDLAYAVPLALAAAIAGAAGTIAPLGGLTLLAVRDDARVASLVAIVGGALAGLVTIGTLLLSLAIPAALALGAGAALVLDHLTPPHRRATRPLPAQ